MNTFMVRAYHTFCLVQTTIELDCVSPVQQLPSCNQTHLILYSWYGQTAPQYLLYCYDFWPSISMTIIFIFLCRFDDLCMLIFRHFAHEYFMAMVGWRVDDMMQYQIPCFSLCTDEKVILHLHTAMTLLSLASETVLDLLYLMEVAMLSDKGFVMALLLQAWYHTIITYKQFYL